MSKFFENKDKNWREKHDYKNLKDFSYQGNEVSKADVTEKEEHEKMKQIKNYHHG